MLCSKHGHDVVVNSQSC